MGDLPKCSLVKHREPTLSFNGALTHPSELNSACKEYIYIYRFVLGLKVVKGLGVGFYLAVF